MRTIITKIKGYTVELEIYREGGEERSDCSVSIKTTSGEFFGSLASLDGTGTLYSGDGSHEHAVNEVTQQLILNWAIKNGY